MPLTGPVRGGMSSVSEIRSLMWYFTQKSSKSKKKAKGSKDEKKSKKKSRHDKDQHQHHQQHHQEEETEEERDDCAVDNEALRAASLEQTRDTRPLLPVRHTLVVTYAAFQLTSWTRDVRYAGLRGVLHAQVVNSWLPSRDHEFTSSMERSITYTHRTTDARTSLKPRFSTPTTT